MAWFDRQKPDLPVVEQEKYSIERIQELLDQVGMLRPKVQHPHIKVFLTRIAQQGESLFVKRSHNGSPSGADIATFQKQLETILRVVEGYIEIENDPDGYPDASMYLKRGRDAIRNFAVELFESRPSGGSASLTNFKVDTQILSVRRL